MSYEIKYYEPCGSNAGHDMKDVLDLINDYLLEEFDSEIYEEADISNIGVCFTSIDDHEYWNVQVTADVIEKSISYAVCRNTGEEMTVTYKEVFPDYDTMYEDVKAWTFDELYYIAKDHATAEALILSDIEYFLGLEANKFIRWDFDDEDITILDDSYTDENGESHSLAVSIDIPAKVMTFLSDGSYAGEWDYTSYEDFHNDLGNFSYEGLYDIAVDVIKRS